ncbi:MAG TPA: WG repeat-containing protein [Saprospiraceae bacterium]|nr:WG repeat-containing protein [Saprospiraceae bacterium]HMQ84349.1 WG repeat-containing protein [Saprospiraceae bacterium]
MKSDIIPYRDGSKWGFMHQDGRIVVPATYEYAYVYYDGYGRFSTDELSGLVSPSGQTILPPTYMSIGNFEDGLATIYTKEEKIGFIDTTGKIVIAPVYDEASDFRNGQAMVKKNDQYMLIKTDGSLVKSLGNLMPFYEEPFYYNPRLLDVQDKAYRLVQQQENYLIGLIDQSGNTVLKPIYESLSHPFGGVMVAQMGGKAGLIRLDGTEITPLEYDMLYRVGADRFLASKSENKFGVLDSKGQAVVPFEYSILYEGIDGQYFVSKDSLIGLMDNQGKIAIPMQYLNLFASQGYIVGSNQQSRMGVLSASNQIVIPFEHDYIEVLSEDRFLVEVNQKRGIMDKKGNWVLAPEYEYQAMMEADHEMDASQEQPRSIVLLFKDGQGTLFNTDGKVISDKKWLYCGYPDPFGHTRATDINGRETVFDRNGKAYAKDAELKKVTVRTAQELFDAIADDTEITLEDGQYDLGMVSGGSDHAAIFDYGFEDRSIVIKNTSNLHLKAKNPGKAQLVTTYEFIPVLRMELCNNISLNGLSVGHEVKPGLCDGAVLSPESVSYLVIENCDLYGSGTVGVEALYCNYLYLRQTTIRECTRGMLYLENSSECRIEKCTMKDNQGGHMVQNVSSYNVFFDQVIFDNNHTPTEYGPYDFFEVRNVYQPMGLKNCTFTNCSADYLATDVTLLEVTNVKRDGLVLRMGESR